MYGQRKRRPPGVEGEGGETSTAPRREKTPEERREDLIAYAFRDNMALGGRFIYSRTLLKLDNAELHFGNEETGTNIVARDFYSLKQTYSAAAIWRQYIPLGRNKRFALFNEMSLAAGGTQARFANDSPVKGLPDGL